MKSKEFELLFKEFIKTQGELIKARDEVKEMKKNFDLITLLRNDEIARIQRLINNEQYIAPSDLAYIYGDAIKLPSDLVEVGHE